MLNLTQLQNDIISAFNKAKSDQFKGTDPTISLASDIASAIDKYVRQAQVNPGISSTGPAQTTGTITVISTTPGTLQ